MAIAARWSSLLGGFGWLLVGALVLMFAPVSYQQQEALTCLPGTGGPRKISSLTRQQLGSGALAADVLAEWDFEGQTGLLAALPGTAVALSCVTAANATVSLPAEPGGPPAFLQPTAIDLSGASGLSMRSVQLSTDCASVLSYQQYFCAMHRVRGSLQLERGAVHFTQWDDGFTELQNVTLTCPSPDSAPQPPCRLAAVQTAQQLLEAFTGYVAASSSNVTIVIAGNISIPTSAWPPTPVIVGVNVTLVGSAHLDRPVIDFNLLTSLWDLLPSAFVTLVNLTCANLAPSYFSPGYKFSQFGMLSERVWAFRRFDRQLYVCNTTLIVPPEQLAYTRYWITFLVSPVPEAQEKAAWMNIINIKVLAINATGVYYDTVVGFTVVYINVRLADSLGSAYPLLPQSTGLKLLLAESVPLTAANYVMNASDLVLALLPNNSVPDEQGRRWFLLVGNVTLSDLAVSKGNSTAVAAFAGSMIVGRDPGVMAARLSLGLMSNAVTVPKGAAVTFRQLILSGLAGSSASYSSSSPLAALGGPLWGLDLSSGASKVRLENCTVLLSADELRLLQQCVLPSEAAAALPGGRSYDVGLLAAATQFYTAADTPQPTAWGPGYLYVDSGATQRYVMYGVTFRTPVAADGEDAAANFTALGVPYASGGGGGRDGLEPWAIGVIVGCIVGGVLLLAAVALLAARRWQWGAAGQDAYAKYLRGSASDASPAGPAAGGGVLYSVNPSQELTNSSQVLRPGARVSDAERGATAAGMVCKLSSENTTSAGIGATGRSTSTTGGVSQETSSGAVGAGVRESGSSAARGLRSPFPAAAGAAAAAALGSEQAQGSVTTDSFERPPTASNLGQHGASERGAGHRLASMLRGGASSAGVGGTSLTPSSPMTGTGTGTAGQPHSVLSTGGGGNALDQLHAMIQVLGRDFNDRQLEVHGLLGKGAHGTVYKGKWRGLPVAVKSMIFNSESSARQQQRPLMEAAISSNLAHPNIVTTYSYELREVEHELASLSPELARQGGGWRLLIIQEYCDAGPLRRIVDCGFFNTPPHKSSHHQRNKLKLPSMGLLRKDSPSASEGSTGTAARAGEAGPTSTAPGCSRGSSGSSVAGNGGGGGGGTRGSPGSAGETSMGPQSGARAAGAQGGNGGSGGAGPGPPGAQPAASGQQPTKAPLDEVPADVPGRPGSALEAALRYVEAALMIARGLQHIHDKNIVHGDLNPNNVLLMRAAGSPLGFCLKVADFGLSVRMAEGESHMSNLFQGSPYYCAPEVVLSGKIGKSADIYSLGIMLWELQHGVRPPWRMGVRLRTFPSLNTGELEFGPDTPPRYARLARDCFHGSKDARPAIAAVVDSLAAIKQELEALRRT